MCNFVDRRGQTGDYLKSGIEVYGTILKKLLPVGLLAQLVKCCTGIVEVKGSNPVQTWIFSGFLFEAAKVVSITAMIFFHIINSQKLQRMPHCRVPTQYRRVLRCLSRNNTSALGQQIARWTHWTCESMSPPWPAIGKQRECLFFLTLIASRSSVNVSSTRTIYSNRKNQAFQE